jgi:ubiquinone/menaquinone biosynthesis C-methylase UbiE
MTITLDVGGEGRHAEAWNLNPSSVKTLGPDRGQPIPRYIPGRAERIPFPEHSVTRIIVERTPLREAALHEIVRVLAPGGVVVLRHPAPPNFDPHRMAKAILPGRVTERSIRINERKLQETQFELDPPS